MVEYVWRPKQALKNQARKNQARKKFEDMKVIDRMLGLQVKYRHGGEALELDKKGGRK